MAADKTPRDWGKVAPTRRSLMIEDGSLEVGHGMDISGSCLSFRDDDCRPIWWATWRSLLENAGETRLTDISEGLEVFGTFCLTKLCDYSDFEIRDRPTLGNWLKVYRGRIGLETFIIFLEPQARWITVSGRYYLDLHVDQQPLEISKGENAKSKISRVYRVSENSKHPYNEGYDVGYELGMSYSWVKALETARKKVWRKAYLEGVAEGHLDNKHFISPDSAKLIGILCFGMGVTVAIAVCYIAGIF